MIILKLLRTSWDKSYKKYATLQEGDVPDTYADVTSLSKLVGYKPNTTVNEGVEKFVKWFKEYYKT